MAAHTHTSSSLQPFTSSLTLRGGKWERVPTVLLLHCEMKVLCFFLEAELMWVDNPLGPCL